MLDVSYYGKLSRLRESSLGAEKREVRTKGNFGKLINGERDTVKNHWIFKQNGHHFVSISNGFRQNGILSKKKSQWKTKCHLKTELFWWTEQRATIGTLKVFGIPAPTVICIRILMGELFFLEIPTNFFLQMDIARCFLETLWSFSEVNIHIYTLGSKFDFLVSK